jgi:threonine/homoserine/homoserine lactone efflux protein
MAIFPLTKKLRATTYFRAFVLNAINVTLSTFIGYITHFYIDKNHNIPSWINIIITLFTAFSTSLIIHLLMFYVFAFGGSMLIEKEQKKQYHLHQGIEKLKNKKKK